ncbi:MAG: hypothetical protein AAGI25_20585 [Bacteroidota bacterium]
MKKNEYQLIHIPRGLYSLRLLMILIISLILPFWILTLVHIKLNFILVILFVFGLAFILFRLSTKFVRNNLHISIRNEELVITETSTLTKNKKEKKINWNNLESYIFKTTQYYHILKLKTKKGKNVMLTFDQNSQHLSRFEKSFHNKVSSLNEVQEGVNVSLKASIYETRMGVILSVILGLLMISWPIIALLNDRDFQIGIAVIFYSGASFFIYMVYRSHRLKK